jgi:hypothetical protein
MKVEFTRIAQHHTVLCSVATFLIGVGGCFCRRNVSHLQVLIERIFTDLHKTNNHASLLLRKSSECENSHEYNSPCDHLPPPPSPPSPACADALSNLTDTVVRVMRHVGRPIDWGVVEKVRHKSSIEYMKPLAERCDLVLSSSFLFYYRFLFLLFFLS